jgi:predicted DNA-binding protein with PD1-like motif
LIHSCEEDVIIVKLEDGEDVHSSLIEVSKKYGVKNGWVLGGVGILREFTLGYFAGKEYIKKYFDKPHELLSLSGSITIEAEVPIHLHCSVSNDQFDAFGGHLFKGTVNVLNEILIKKFTTIELGRRLNPKTGYFELDIKA